jgi:hypothetical protein
MIGAVILGELMIRILSLIIPATGKGTNKPERQ